VPKKPHIKALREAIANKIDIKISQIYKKAKVLSTEAQTRTEDGIYLLAARSGINLNKYLPKEKVEEIRNLLFQLNQHVKASRLESTSKKSMNKAIQLTVGKTFEVAESLLPHKVVSEAKEMAEVVYPLLYVFENSVRGIIIRVMQSAHGSNWWDTKVSKDIQQEVQKRRVKEDQNPWHGKRGVHPIYYTDLEHLGRIVQNNWADFKAILPTIQWLTQRVDEISHSRNPVAHMNPLSKDDIQRIKVYFRDWEKQIRSKRTIIP
jgi:hypothetical protein